MRGMITPCRELYERFYDGFASHGEPNIPFDRTFLQSDPFYALLARLKQHIEEHQRDHWCAVWPPSQKAQTFLQSGLVLTLGKPKETGCTGTYMMDCPPALQGPVQHVLQVAHRHLRDAAAGVQGHLVELPAAEARIHPSRQNRAVELYTQLTCDVNS